MKHISLRILFLCILVPPLLFVYTIQTLEKYVGERFREGIHRNYIGDTAPLFDGSRDLREAVTRNIDQYLSESLLIDLGVKATVTVATRDGIILYPQVFEEPRDDFAPPDLVRTAAENYQLLTEGLTVSTGIEIGFESWISLGVLGAYLLASVLVLFGHYRSGTRKAMGEEEEKLREIASFRERAQAYADRLRHLEEKRARLVQEFEVVQSELAVEKERASRNEDDMIEEILALEGKIGENLALQKEQQEEIEALRLQIQQYEKSIRRDDKQKAREIDTVEKRFRVLYKNLAFHPRALEGFVDLPENFRIKCEEMIHQLNDDPKLVPIKRKVFGKKNRETVFESIFSYRGRLYYRTLGDNRMEVLVVGTKNTQGKDLEFLDNL